MVRFRDVLFKKDFFSLWIGQIISEFGDRLNQMALIALVYSKKPGSVMAMANLLFFIVIPVFVIGPVAGVYVDRWNRKHVMIISDILRGLLVLTVPIFIYLDAMVPIYIIVFVMFSTTRFFLPSKMAIIPAIVAEEKLVVANSLSNTTRIIATVLGLAAAGFIVKWIGYISGFYLDGISFFVSAGFIALISVGGPAKNVREELKTTYRIIGKSIRRDFWREMVEGFAHMFKKTKMRIVTGTMVLLMGGVGSIFCVIIVFIQNAFGSVTEDLGLFGSFLGAGLLMGTVAFGKFGQKLSKVRAIFFSLAGCGIVIGLFAAYVGGSGGFLVAAFMIMASGAAAAPILTCANTLMHTLVPDEARGRIFSSMEIAAHLSFLVFMFLTAWLAKYFSNMVILMASGGVFAIIGLAGQFFARGEVLPAAGESDQQDL